MSEQTPAKSWHEKPEGDEFIAIIESTKPDIVLLQILNRYKYFEFFARQNTDLPHHYWAIDKYLDNNSCPKYDAITLERWCAGAEYLAIML